MSAGTGVAHSEYNASKTEPCTSCRSGSCRRSAGIAPSYEQKTFTPRREARHAAPRRLARRARRQRDDPRRRALYAGLFDAGAAVALALAPGRHAWVHVARGNARVNGQALEAGDAVALSGEPDGDRRGSRGRRAGEVLVFDLA